MPPKKKINKTKAVLKFLRSYGAISAHRAHTHFNTYHLAQIIEGIRKRHLRDDEQILWNDNKKQYQYYETYKT